MKFSGKVGFWKDDVEVKPGSYKSVITEKHYTGDVLNNVRRFQPGENQQNENLNVSNKISIISDLYMQDNWPSIKYVEWKGVKWKATSIDAGAYPRVVIELGGIYNGSFAPTQDIV